MFDKGVSSKFSLICGFHRGLERETSIPSSPSILESLLVSANPIKISDKLSVPMKHHVLPVNALDFGGVYGSAILSYLSSISAITILLNSKHNLNWNYPPAISSMFSVANAECDSHKLGIDSATKIIFRNDLFTVDPCFQDGLLNYPEYGSMLMYGGFYLEVFLAIMKKMDERVSELLK
jgi:hypothetical protein